LLLLLLLLLAAVVLRMAASSFSDSSCRSRYSCGVVSQAHKHTGMQVQTHQGFKTHGTDWLITMMQGAAHWVPQAVRLSQRFTDGVC
jgi:hypothetical protein